MKRVTKRHLITCVTCEQRFPKTMFAEEGICVYCASKAKKGELEAEKPLVETPKQRQAREQQEIRNARLAAMKRLEEERERKRKLEEEINVQMEAKKELAQRQLAANNLLAFTKRYNQKYKAGWVHRDICEKLEWFSAAIAAGESPRLILTMPPRHGKQLADSTPVLTSHGWVAHGDLRRGMDVFHPSGKPIKVLEVSEKTPSKWVVAFSNGQRIRCHENHEWTVYHRASRKWMTVPTHYFTDLTRFGEPRKLLSGNRSQYQLPKVTALEFPEKELTIPPYVLGAWLGDGSRGKGCLTHDAADQAVVDRIVRNGYEVSATCAHKDTGVITTYFSGPRPGVIGRMLSELREIGVDTDKHIPEVYLRGSITQRLELLAGLVDTDGHTCSKTGRMRFTTADRHLADGVLDLCTGLGFRPYLTVEQPKLSSSGIQGRREYYVVGWQPTLDVPCELERKRVTRLASQRHIGITAVEYDPTGEQGHCIEVDSPDGLYLAGTTLIPTHNSELASRNFPAWHLGKYPDHEVITCSYAATLASGFSKKVREMCRDNNFNKLFPEFALDMEAQSVEHWMTKQGGGLAAAGVGGPITGKGAHVLIIDDPIKNRDEAESISTRESIWNWFTSTAYTRLAPGGGVLCIQTRWHDDDLAGRLITRSEEDEENTEDWVVVNYPAIAVTDELYRRQGEALHNDRYPLHTLERIRKTIGNRDFSALYQQNPVPENGELFTSDMVRYYKQSELPDFETMNFYTAWDLAIGQKETNDRTVGITVGVDAKLDIWIVDIRIGRWGSMEIVDRILDTYQAWRSTVTGIEKGQIEMSIRPILNERMRERKLSSMFIEDLRTGRQDKVARSRPIIARMQQGRVFFPSEHPLVMEVINELLRFPNGVHDDCADALSWIGWLLEYFTAVRPAKQKPKKSWRDKLGKFMRTTNTKSHMGS